MHHVLFVILSEIIAEVGVSGVLSPRISQSCNQVSLIKSSIHAISERLFYNARTSFIERLEINRNTPG